MKRKLTPFSSGERVAELTRKARSLQVELDEAKAKLETQEKELVSTKKQVELLELSKQLKEQKSAVRILELEDNPAARHEKVKQAMITALRKENEALLEQISDLQSPSDDENRHNQSKLVPYSSLERLQNEIQQLNNTIADQTKRTERLKQVFSKNHWNSVKLYTVCLAIRLIFYLTRRFVLLPCFLPIPKTKALFSYQIQSH